MRAGQKMVQIYLEPEIYKELRKYAFENDMPLAKVIRPLTDEFQASVKKLVEELRTLQQEPIKVEV